jgi:hypothetical protein
MRAHLKGFSARIVMSSESMVTWYSGLLPNPAKVPYFQYMAWWYSIVQKFHNDGKNIQESQFWASMLHWPMAIIRQKSLNFKIGHDGILSIGNFMLMIKNHIFYFYSCPLTDQQPKNVLPISVATWNFLFILYLHHIKISATYLFRKIRYGHLSVEFLFLKKLFFSQKSSFLIKCLGRNSH